MPDADRIVRALAARGELWEVAPGLVGMRGDLLALRERLERLLVAATAAEGEEHWLAPPAIALETLARAEYFASFPQWLTLASHLTDDRAALERVATSARPYDAARASAAPASVALPPAMCYHAYAGLAGATLDAPRAVRVCGACWRHEGAALRPLARGWAFTMCESVCVGDAASVGAFRARGLERVRAVAGALGLAHALEDATDPFFAPTARGRALLQRVKSLKQELRLPVGDETIAAASVNQHEAFFGEAFAICTADGAPAWSACVAFGVERWLLAFLAAHGTHARGWPAIPDALGAEVAA